MFNNVVPEDLIELNMRIRAGQRQVLQQMFVSEKETRIMLETALERALTSMDLVGQIKTEAEKAVGESIKHYFSYGGKGKGIIDTAVKDLMSKLLVSK